MESFEDFLSNPTKNSSNNSIQSNWKGEKGDRIEESIRSSIKSQVDDVLWMNELNHKLETISLNSNASISEHSEPQRCIVCTLPLGTCSHTTPWLQSNFHESLLSTVDSELDQVLGVLDKTLVVNTKPQWQDIDINNVRWAEHLPRVVDKIGNNINLFIYKFMNLQI